MLIQDVGTREVLSRNEAAMRGLSRFYTGMKCRQGHQAERFVSNRQCVICNAVKARQHEREKARREPWFRLYRNTLRRSGMALSGRASPVYALGCDQPALRAFMEARFRVGMAWENYRQWEVDHVRPLCAATSLSELIELCHFTNLQPLWRRENRMKGGA
jgi:hypothetical protein